MGLKKTRNKDGDWCECRLEVHPNDAQELFMLALGTRLGVAAVPITDVADEKRAIPEKPKGGELARRAGILCQDERFQVWVYQRENPDETVFPGNPIGYTLTTTAAWLRGECGINSRAELDHNSEAAKRFLEIETEFKQAHGMMAEKR